MIIENVQVFREEQYFAPGEIVIHDGVFAKTANSMKEEVIDGEGCYAVPGLIDLHFHGCAGVDFCDAKGDTLRKMAEYEASVGVTSICPAVMTMGEEELLAVMRTARNNQDGEGAKLTGINLEGPFLNEKKKGAQAAEHIRNCDLKLYRSLQKESGGLIRIVDLAPEKEGAMEFIEAIRSETVVSLAHTLADYETSMEAFRRGASHVTHLFNAMPPLHHREPGVIGAAYDTKSCRVELISDGVHVHPAAVRMVFRMFGAERVILISDSMRATGLGDGQYTLGGQEVFVEGARAVLEDGSVAGSVTILMECVRKAVKEMGIPLEEALTCVTRNPALELGIYDRCGSIAPGKAADLVLLDTELQVKAVYINGKKFIPPC